MVLNSYFAAIFAFIATAAPAFAFVTENCGSGGTDPNITELMTEEFEVFAADANSLSMLNTGSLFASPTTGVLVTPVIDAFGSKATTTAIVSPTFSEESLPAWLRLRRLETINYCDPRVEDCKDNGTDEVDWRVHAIWSSAQPVPGFECDPANEECSLWSTGEVEANRLARRYQGLIGTTFAKCALDDACPALTRDQASMLNALEVLRIRSLAPTN